jgi:polyisoprenoid-binding protein YceI
MKRRTAIRLVGGVLAAVAVAFIVLSAYIYVTGGSGEASRAVQARRVEPDRQVGAESAPESSPDGGLEESQPEPTGYIIYEAVAGRSEARFLIDEVLRGEPKTVVGRTDQVDGSIAVQFEPARVEIGEFEINLRTIATDDEMRDRTIRGMILETNRDEFEFSTFVPTAVSGVPDTLSPGSSMDLTVTGDLTVRNVTRSVDFEMMLQIRSKEQLEGFATTRFTWEEFEITIPYVGGDSIVNAVDDWVVIEMKFVALADAEG